MMYINDNWFADYSADQLAQEIYSNLLHDQSYGARFGLLLDHLKQAEQLAILEAIFRDIQKKHFPEDLSGARSSVAPNETITGVATLCSAIIGDRIFLRNQITEWLAKSQGGSIQTVGLRRALLATFTDQAGKFPRA